MSDPKEAAMGEDFNAKRICCQRYFGLALALAPALSWIILSIWLWLRYRDAYLEFGKEFPVRWDLVDIIRVNISDIYDFVYISALVFISAVGLALFIKPTRMRFVGAIYMALLLVIIVIFTCLIISSDLAAPDFN